MATIHKIGKMKWSTERPRWCGMSGIVRHKCELTECSVCKYDHNIISEMWPSEINFCMKIRYVNFAFPSVFQIRDDLEHIFRISKLRDNL